VEHPYPNSYVSSPLGTLPTEGNRVDRFLDDRNVHTNVTNSIDVQFFLRGVSIAVMSYESAADAYNKFASLPPGLAFAR